MAVTLAQAEIAERRLRPLYDAIDNGQNKKAVQMADKILKKQDNLHCAKALKAIALLRLGRQDEANPLIDGIMKARPGDQATLQAVTMFFRETGESRRIVELYAAAAEHYPKNAEILTHLFMSYVRIGDYQKQQQTAASLHKAFPTNGPYYCWRIMSILMQAHESRDQTMVKNIYLPLAERLIEKYINENKVEAEAEVKLYLMVLDKLGKTEKKLEVIRGELGEKFHSKEERTNVELECLLALERIDEVVEKLTKLLREKPDQWSFIRTYIDCQIQRYLRMRDERASKEESDESKEGGEERHGSSQLTGGGEANGDDRTAMSGGGRVECVERTAGGSPSAMQQDQQESECAEASAVDPCLRPLVEARDLFEYLVAEEQRKVEKAEKTHIYRGPFLARMELVRQLRDRKLLGELDLEIVFPLMMLMDYYKVFGTKNCVFDDLRMYLDTFRTEDVNEFISRLEEMVGGNPVDFDCDDDHVKQNVDHLRMHISLMQLQRVWGHHQELGVEGKQALLAHCRHWHKQGLKLGRNLSPNVNQHSDFYVVLATHLQLELHQETGDWSYVWEAVFLLEQVKGSNAQLFLLLMKLYGYLGASECITDIFEKLFIKHMQTETLGYIPVRYLQSMGTFGYAEQLYRSGHRVYYGCIKEISEYIIQAYKNGMFQKIMEFVALRDRISHSLNFACVLVDMNVLELITSVRSIETGREFFAKDWFSGMPYSSSNLQAYCSRLVDSRDLRVFDDWSPSRSRLSDIEVKISFDLECLWLRVRVVLVQCLREAVLFTPGSETSGDSKRPTSSTNDTSDKNSDKEGVVLVLSQRIRDFTKCLELLDQHVGMLILRQRKGSLLPVQSPPPCLGYTFLCESHGRILLAMLSTTESVILGATSVVERLKDILRMLETAKSRIAGVPEDLRSGITQIGSFSDSSEEDHPNLSLPTHPYKLLMKSRIDLERYVMFVQVMSHLVLLCAVCAEAISPTTVVSSKKKKKKQSTPKKSPVTDELVNFVKELKVLILLVSQQFHPLPSVEEDQKLADQLRRLYISKETKHEPSFEHSVAANVCRAVLESYNMSLRDCLQVVHTKVEFMNSIIVKLGGSEKLPVDP